MKREKCFHYLNLTLSSACFVRESRVYIYEIDGVVSNLIN